jgi:hypothetical protein
VSTGASEQRVEAGDPQEPGDLRMELRGRETWAASRRQDLKGIPKSRDPQMAPEKLPTRDQNPWTQGPCSHVAFSCLIRTAFQPADVN